MDKDNEFYDNKFKEMQEYLPFLDEIITKIENVSNDDNHSVRGIQLSKIKSLKSLLCVTDKRMKIENLLRCEQILKKLKDKVGKFPKSEMTIENTSLSDTIETRNKEEKVTIVPNFYKESYNKNVTNDPEKSENLDKPEHNHMPENIEKSEILENIANVESCEIILEKAEKSDKSESIEKSEQDSIPPVSDFQLSRMKLQEITKKVDSDIKEVIPPPIPTVTASTKSYEKEIELVTKVYINDKCQIDKLSKMITESIGDVNKKNSSLDTSDNSEKKILQSKIVIPSRNSPKLKSEITKVSSDSNRGPHNKSGASPNRKQNRKDYRSRWAETSQRPVKRLVSPPRYNRSYNHHRDGKYGTHSKSIANANYQNKSQRTSIAIDKICDTVKHKRKQNESTIDQLLLDEVNLGERASISFLKKMRKKLKKEIKLEKEIKMIVESRKKNSLEGTDGINKAQIIEDRTETDVTANNDDITSADGNTNLMNVVASVNTNINDLSLTSKLVNNILHVDDPSDQIPNTTLSNDSISILNALKDNIKGEMIIELDKHISSINLPQNILDNVAKSIELCSKLSIQHDNSVLKSISSPSTESGKIVHSKFEQDVLDALKNEINENTEQKSIFENIPLKPNEINPSSKKIDKDKDNENINIQKLRRISLEKYKEKLNIPQNPSIPEIVLKVENTTTCSDALNPITNAPAKATDYFKPDPNSECKIIDPNISLQSTSQANDNVQNLTPESEVQSFESSTPMSPDSIEDDSQYQSLPDAPCDRSFHDTMDMSISSEETTINKFSTPACRTYEISVKENNVYSRPLGVDEEKNMNLNQATNTQSFPNIPLRELSDDSNLKCSNMKQMSPVSNYPQSKQNKPSHIGDKPNTREDVKKSNYPKFNERFNVNFPVSANYKGKNPKPKFGYGQYTNTIPTIILLDNLIKPSDIILNDRSLINLNCDSKINNFPVSNFGQKSCFKSLEQNNFGKTCHNDNIQYGNSPKQGSNYYHPNANNQKTNQNDDRHNMEHFKKDPVIKTMDKLSSLYTDINSLNQRTTNISHSSSTFKNISPVINSESLKELSLHKNSKFKKVLLPTPLVNDDKKPLLPTPEIPKLMDPLRKIIQDPRIKNLPAGHPEDRNFDESRFSNSLSPRLSTAQIKDNPKDPRIKRQESNDASNYDKRKHKESLERMMSKKLGKEESYKCKDNSTYNRKYSRETSSNSESDLKLKSSNYKIPKLKRDEQEKNSESDQLFPKNQKECSDRSARNETDRKSNNSSDNTKEKSFDKYSSRNANTKSELKSSSNKKFVILDETDKFVVYDEMETQKTPPNSRKNNTIDKSDNSEKDVTPKCLEPLLSKEEKCIDSSVDMNIKIENDDKINISKSSEELNKPEIPIVIEEVKVIKNNEDEIKKNTHAVENNSKFDQFVSDIKNTQINKDSDKTQANKNSKPVAEVLPVCQPVEVVPESKDVVTSLLDVLKDKTKMLELLTNSENLPPKLKRKLELLAEIESDDDCDNDEDTKDSVIESRSSPVTKSLPLTDLVKTVEKTAEVLKASDAKKPSSAKNIADIKSRSDTEKAATIVTPPVVGKLSTESKNEKNNKNNTPEPPKTTRGRGKTRLNEVDLLREALPEVFINQGGLDTTGIRMCRLAKEFNNTNDNVLDKTWKKRVTRQTETKKSPLAKKTPETESSTKGEIVNKNNTDHEKHLMIVVEKCNINSVVSDSESLFSYDNVSQDSSMNSDSELSIKIKPCPKSKKRAMIEKAHRSIEENLSIKNKALPKSKKLKIDDLSDDDVEEKDNELDKSTSSSIYDYTDEKLSDEEEAITSEIKTNVKNGVKRRKRSKWKSGTITKKIKSSNKKQTPANSKTNDSSKLSIIDKSYHFLSGNKKYKCKYCTDYQDENIVNHYMEVHPNMEILISRLSPQEAKLAIDEATLQDIPENLLIGDHLVTNYNDFQCRFCNKQFKNASLLTFYTHIVTIHTGEFIKNRVINMDNLSAINTERNVLKGFLCEKCNYVQVLKKNLETHIISKHSLEECKIFEIHFSKYIKEKQLKSKNYENTTPLQTIKTDNILNSFENINKHLIRSSSPILKDMLDIPPLCDDGVFSTSKNSQSFNSELDNLNISTVNSINELDIKEEIMCPNDDLAEEIHNITVKFEPEEYIENEDVSHNDNVVSNVFNINMEVSDSFANTANESQPICNNVFPSEYSVTVGDVVVRTMSRDSIEYMCNIKNCTFKTIYFISFALHLETLHINDTWNGYCTECGNIVQKTSEPFTYNQAFAHVINYHIKHNENGTVEIISEKNVNANKSTSSRIQVRPISDLLPQSNATSSAMPSEPYREKNNKKVDTFIQPRIESVVSLNPDNVNITIGNAENDQLRSIYNDVNSVVASNDSSKVDVVEKIHSDQSNTGSFVKLGNQSDNQPFINIMNHPNTQVNDSFKSSNSKDSNNERPPFFFCGSKECNIATNKSTKFLSHIKAHSNLIEVSFATEDYAWQTCIYCKAVIKKDQDLLLHIINEHGRCKFKCSDCPFLSVSFILTFSHSKIMHPSIKDSLRVQEITPYHESEQKIPEMNPKVDCFLPYICTVGASLKGNNSMICGENFFTPSTFLNHIAIKHKNENIVCQICMELPMSPTALIMHLRKNHHYHLYKCPYCPRGADTQTLMLNHLMQFHSSYNPIFYHYYIPEGKINSGHKIVAINFDDNIDYHLKNIFGFSIDDVQDDVSTSILNSHDSAATVTMKKAKKLSKSGNLKRKSDSQNTGSKCDDNTEQNYLIESNLSKADTAIGVDKPSDVIVVDSDDEVMCLNDTVEKTDKTSNVEQLLDEAFSDGDDTQEIDNNQETSMSADDLDGNDSTIVFGERRKSRSGIHGLVGKDLLKCGNAECNFFCELFVSFVKHLGECSKKPENKRLVCYHCKKTFKNAKSMTNHLFTHSVRRYQCGLCNYGTTHRSLSTLHARNIHKIARAVAIPLDPKKTNHYTDYFIMTKPPNNSDNKKIKTPIVIDNKPEKKSDPVIKVVKNKQTTFGPEDISNLPLFPILPENIFCSVCSFSTKVRSNMYRHLQLHSSDVAVPTVAPVNPVPHLQSNEMHFDKMTNLALSSNIDRPRKINATKQVTVFTDIPIYIPKKKRFVCGSQNCLYISLNELMLKQHWETLHNEENIFHCVHCDNDINNQNTSPNWFVTEHLQLHGKYLYRCEKCSFMHFTVQVMKKHGMDKHGVESFIILRGDTLEEDGAKWLWECTICSIKVPTKKEITDHTSKFHGTGHPYKCGACKYSTFTEEEMKLHCKAEHTGLPPNFTLMYFNKFVNDQPSTSNSPLWWKQRKRPSHFISENLSKEQVDVDQPPLKKIKSVDRTPKKSNVTNKTNRSSNSEDTSKQVIKIEDIEHDVVAESKEDLKIMNSDGTFGEPKNNEYSCPFCNKFTCSSEDTMRIHLYEELNYRKWWCGICGYKAFDSERINIHISEEHRGSTQAGELHPDDNREQWIEKCLQSQSAHISSEHDFKDSSFEKNMTLSSAMPMDDIDLADILNIDEDASLLKSINPALLSETIIDDSSDDDEDRLVICDKTKKNKAVKQVEPEHVKVEEQITCIYCNYTTPTLRGMSLHKRVHWKVKPFGCNYCGFQCLSVNHLQNHHKLFHDGEVYRVVKNEMPEVPEYETGESEPSSSNPLDENAIPYFICLQCKVTLKSEDKECHRLSCHPAMTGMIVNKQNVLYKCPLCKRKKKWPSESFLRNHFRLKHPGQTYNCFLHVSTTVVDKKSHPEIMYKNLFCCTYCKQEFKTFLGQIKHHRIRHESSLIRLLPITTEKILSTSELKKTFKLKENYYECIITSCNIKFNDYDRFYLHVKNHYCAIKCNCTYSFQSRELFSEHSSRNGHKEIDLDKEAEVLDRLRQIDLLLNVIDKNESIIMKPEGSSTNNIETVDSKEAAKKPTNPDYDKLVLSVTDDNFMDFEIND